MSGSPIPSTLLLAFAAASTGAWLALDMLDEVRAYVGRARTILLLAAAAAFSAAVIVAHRLVALGFAGPTAVADAPLWSSVLPALLALTGTAAAMLLARRQPLDGARATLAAAAMTAGLWAINLPALATVTTGTASGGEAWLGLLLSLAIAAAAAWTCLWFVGARRALPARAGGALFVGAALCAACVAALGAARGASPPPSAPAYFALEGAHRSGPGAIDAAATVAAGALLLLLLALVAARAVRSEEDKRITSLRGNLDRAGRLAGMNAVAATLAHELNQPLTAARNYAFVLKRTLSEDEANREFVERIEEQLGRSGEIIRKARLLASAGAVEREAIDVRASVDRCLALLRMDGALREPEMRIGFAAGERTILADPVQFEQVLVNILRNGWQALATTQQARMTIKSPAPQNGTITLIISDNGPGFPGKTWDDPLAGLSSGTKGLGLGLGIARTIVEGHGGKLWAESNLLRGATFYVRLPGGP
ncbi:sensor histidine kinase [Allosphingosinicella deserti]|uniref:histidine kinase n=1 Tax=Allosphingosinicella deserti TaxID=2116704 RepID=A0A2P7QM40_9SPHN|nr:HAMP domain-containing sensor histidine kinase [Sphingomonas deserti]PSJ39032.1 hypothetical protein C7I55_17195 [Sphingomonas deserti]